MKRLLSLFFHLLYHTFAPAYDFISTCVSLGRWRKWTFSVIPRITGTRILELGCGPGHLLVELHVRGLRAYGVDESRQMVRMARGNLNRKHTPIRLIRGRAENLSLPSTYFDTVVATFPSPYISRPKTLREIRRVLMPGGKLVVLLAAWITGRRLIDRLLAFIFRVTGEAPHLDDTLLSKILAPYQQAGFETSLHWIETDGTRLMVIEAISA